jgi:pyridoxal phosphate enzyme (YggS family)
MMRNVINATPDLAVRRAELKERLAAVRARIAAACRAAGREPDEITLIAVTKTFPARDVRLLAGLGVREVGENFDQEAAAKAAACAALMPPLTWHFIGQLQTNKSASVVSYASVIHSVDRLRLVHALGRQARKAERAVICLLQVSLDGAPGRGGALESEIPPLAEAVAAEDHLVLGGVMAMAPPQIPAAKAFEPLPRIAGLVRQFRPEATMVSAGMSGDMEEAIAAGATHLRIGTALLGGRPAFVG